ncbi:TPA: DNA topoisomerase 3 [Salmonella enterica subsp. enterica serovar Ohio]|nr:DNA topoisomerase 3 [Salmonella enterica subsp. enterica serovar Ohio]
MRLFIAEKPAVANDIVKALGGDFTRKDGYFESGTDIVTNCFGHIIESQPPENYNPAYKLWSLQTLPLKLFPVKYQPKESSAHQVKTILELLKRGDVTEIVHAGDPDDEGQLLVDEVLEYARNTKPVKRVLINDNTLPAVKKALANLKDNRDFKGMSLKALARSVADAVYGFSMTRAYTIPAKARGYQGVLSVGRVQTPVLGLIVKRTRAHQSHDASVYYTMTGHFVRGNDVFTASWKPGEFAPLIDKRLIDRAWAYGTASNLEGKRATVEAAAVDDKETAAPLPFNLLRLQRWVIKKYKLTAQKVQDITQTLKDTHKAITYNRSDCSYLSDEQFNSAPATLAALKGILNPNFDIDATRKSKAFDNSKVTAHTAIIPTNNVPDLNRLSNDERNVYMEIVNLYAAQFMPRKTYKEASIAIKNGDESFVIRAKKTTNNGFEALIGSDGEDDFDEDSANDGDNSVFELLSKIRTGEQLTTNKVIVNEKKTTPPPLFTESSLLGALVRVADYVTNPEIKKLLKEKDKDKKDEHGGIGTPATRAAILETLKKRNYITVEKGKLIPTETGYALFDSLPDNAVNPDMTALWSEKQTAIENGELSVEQFINELYSELEGLVAEANVDNLKVEPRAVAGQAQRLESPCPNCGKDIVIRPKVCVCTGCEFKIYKTLSSKVLTDKQIDTLINKGITSELKGFVSNKNNKEFSAKVKLVDKVTGKLGFEFVAKKA